MKEIKTNNITYNRIVASRYNVIGNVCMLCKC